MGFPGRVVVKNLPSMQKTWVQSLEKGMATHSNILAWKIPRTEEPGGLQSMGSQTVRHHLATKHAYTQSPEAEADSASSQ